MKNVRASLLLGSAVLLCPCHLPVLIALLASSVGGTALAAFLHQNVGPVVAFSTAYFVLALWLGRRLLIPSAVRPASGGGHQDARFSCAAPRPYQASVPASGRSR